MGLLGNNRETAVRDMQAVQTVDKSHKQRRGTLYYRGRRWDGLF